MLIIENAYFVEFFFSFFDLVEFCLVLQFEQHLMGTD